MAHRKLSPPQVIGWTALGAATGLITGLLLAEWVGDLSLPRAKRTLARVAGPGRVESLGTSAAERAAERSLRAVIGVGARGLTAVGVRRGVVELHGWVNDRAERRRAVAAVRAVEGIEAVRDRILVRGEDDAPAAEMVEEQVS
ncbi:MAG TPA: BON domain-containing protein [Gemmatimonadales bacterium]|nr:BON domain-containing protein [Gemmatimonadales bacterium]